MTTPTQNNGNPSEQSNRPAQPSFALPATSLINTIDGARQHLPVSTSAATSTSAPPRSLSIQREPPTEISRIFANAIREHTPAPAILHRPASELILQLLTTSVKQRKSILAEPRWFYEYLARHIDEFQDKEILQRLFSCLMNAAGFDILPSPNSQESETLSQLVSKLCSHTENSKDFICAYERVIYLLIKLEYSNNARILSPQAFHRFLAVVKVLPSFQNCDAFFIVVSQYSKSMAIEWEPELVDCFAKLIVAFYRGDRLPPIITSLIPGIIHPLLTQGETSAENRLELCHCSSSPGVIMSPSEREKLLTICDDIADSVGNSIMDQDNESLDNVSITTFKYETREKVVSAIVRFGKIASDARLAPLTQDEIEVQAKLIRHLANVSSTSDDINQVLSSLAFLYKSHTCQELKTLEEAIIHLMKAAVHNFDMQCLSRHSDGYNFLILANKFGSRIYTAVILELLTRLKDVVSVSTEEDFLDGERIAKAFYIAGLLADFPHRDCRDEVTIAIKHAFGALACLLVPSTQVNSSSLNDLIALLLSHYASGIAVERAFIEDFCHFFSGLETMACHKMFHGFPESDKGQTFRKLLDFYRTLIELEELSFDEDEPPEILFRIGSLAEICEKSPGLNFLLDGQHFSCADLLLKSVTYISNDSTEKIISGVGKLVVHNRLGHLSSEAKESLNKLITACFNNLRDQKDPKVLDYSEFLFILSHLYLKGLLGPECKNLNISSYRPLLLHKWKQNPPRSIEQISKILFFIDAVQPLETEKDTAATEEKVAFASYVKEMKTQMEQYLAKTRRDGNNLRSPHKRQKTSAES